MRTSSTHHPCIATLNHGFGQNSPSQSVPNLVGCGTGHDPKIHCWVFSRAVLGSIHPVPRMAFILLVFSDELFKLTYKPLILPRPSDQQLSFDAAGSARVHLFSDGLQV